MLKVNRSDKKVDSAVQRFVSFFYDMNNCVVKRKHIVTQLMLAVACNEHLLLEGKAGVAKSYMANLFLDNIVGADTFKVQCTRKMSEDYIVGPLDMKLFREDGIMHHRTENTIVDCEFAFVDEIFDLSSGALRGLLEVLNERTFTRGSQHVKSSLMTCIAATNFNRDDDEELEAVIDRFMFRAKVTSLTSDKDKIKMLTLNGTMPKLPFEDVLRVQKIVRAVTIPKDVIVKYVKLLGVMEGITDRSLRKGLKVLQVSAAIKGRSQASLIDIAACEGCFSITGDAESAAKYGAVMKEYAGMIKEKEDKCKGMLLFNRAVNIEKEITSALEKESTEYAEISDICGEAATIRILSRKLEDDGFLSGKIAMKVEAILAQGTKLREEELKNASN